MKNQVLIAFMLMFSLGITAQGIKVSPGSCIIIEEGSTVEIITGNLLIQSDANSDASLIDRGTLSITSGEATDVERYITPDAWHLISSPNDIALSGMFEGHFLQYYNTSGDTWNDIVLPDYQMNVMQGYSIWSVATQDTIFVYTATTNTGEQSAGFTNAGSSFNLLGNPYPSGLDWDEVAIPAGLSSGVYMWDPELGDYVYYINGGGVGNTTTSYIPSGQGFMVYASGGSGTLSLDNADRTHAGQQAFFKSGNHNEIVLLKVTGNNITTQAAVRFHPDATPGHDPLFDVHKIISNVAKVPKLYSINVDGKHAINTLASVTETETVPLGFEAGIDGEYTITASELDSFDPATTIILEDQATNTFVDLRANPVYTFYHQGTEQRNMFLHFKDSQGIGDDLINPLESQLLIYAANKMIHVNFSEEAFAPGSFNARIDVFTVHGQLLKTVETSQTMNEIRVYESRAIYMIRVLVEGKMVSKKVFNN